VSPTIPAKSISWTPKFTARSRLQQRFPSGTFHSNTPLNSCLHFSPFHASYISRPSSHSWCYLFKNYFTNYRLQSLPMNIFLRFYVIRISTLFKYRPLLNMFYSHKLKQRLTHVKNRRRNKKAADTAPLKYLPEL